MDGRSSGIQFRRVGITSIVVVVHIAAIAFALTLHTKMTTVSDPPVIRVAFADPPLVEHVPEPEPEKPPPPISTPNPSDRRPVIRTRSRPPVLSVGEPGEPDFGLTSEGATDQVEQDLALPVEAETLARVLQNASCQRLIAIPDDDCPKPDPFTVAEASVLREQAPPAPPNLVGDFSPKTRLEQFFNQQDRDPYLMPGMDADLFTESVGAAAYNAQRIRNGQAPIWDRDLEEALRRRD